MNTNTQEIITTNKKKERATGKNKQMNKPYMFS